MHVCLKYNLIGKSPRTPLVEAPDLVRKKCVALLLSCQAWAKTEGDLLRALVAYLKDRTRRNDDVRPQDYNRF